MTEQEKNTLIEWCHWRIALGSKGIMSEQTLKAAEIALASLTAQPVKLPKIKHPAQFDYADEVVEALKSHGIEVEE